MAGVNSVEYGNATTRPPADADPQEKFLRSAVWRGRLAPENSRTRTDADH